MTVFGWPLAVIASLDSVSVFVVGIVVAGLGVVALVVAWCVGSDSEERRR